jgi:hypothetical protein
MTLYELTIGESEYLIECDGIKHVVRHAEKNLLQTPGRLNVVGIRNQPETFALLRGATKIGKIRILKRDIFPLLRTNDETN